MRIEKLPENLDQELLRKYVREIRSLGCTEFAVSVSYLKRNRDHDPFLGLKIFFLDDDGKEQFSVLVARNIFRKSDDSLFYIYKRSRLICNYWR